MTSHSAIVPDIFLVVRRHAGDGVLSTGARFAVGQGVLLVGRTPGADIVLQDATVSRRHCELVRRGDGWSVTNCSRNNGVFVNRQPLAPGERTDVAVLERLQLGGVVLEPEIVVATREVRSIVTGEQVEGTAPQDSSPMFTLTVDADSCAVACGPVLMALAPQAAKAFYALCRTPGQLVHTWDIQEIVGVNANVTQLMSELRASLRAEVVAGRLDEERLRHRVAAVHGEHASGGDLRDVLLKFVYSRRKHGYLVCLTDDDIATRDLR